VVAADRDTGNGSDLTVAATNFSNVLATMNSFQTFVENQARSTPTVGVLTKVDTLAKIEPMYQWN